MAKLLQVANEQKQLYDKIENVRVTSLIFSSSLFQYKEQIKKHDTRILNFQAKLLEAESLLLPVLHQGKTSTSLKSEVLNF